MLLAKMNTIFLILVINDRAEFNFDANEDTITENMHATLPLRANYIFYDE